ncbi:MAG: site-specific DNA-methyltransferase [Chloroflexales bacterium]|nr:site-specific DNA-methyltransferase [Chloroflexales bacterium]
MPPPYDQDEWVTLYCGDNTALLPLLAPSSVDLVLPDPPYNVANADIRLPSGKVRMVRDFGESDKQDWTLVAFFDAVARLLRPGGSVIAFCSDYLVSLCMKYPPLRVRGSMLWVKTNPAIQFRPRSMKCHEHIVWLTQPAAPAVWNGDGTTRNVFEHLIVQGHALTEHPTQKPLCLMKVLVRLHSNAGDLVLDPFAGSGTTLRAAKDLGRKAIGIEMDERSCAIAAQRLDQGVFAFDAAA